MIRYLTRQEIQDELWNKVIAASAAETIYPYSWYLDICADHWGAFVKDNYQYIMPVAFRKKMGIRYLYQPVYCQQLGIYSSGKGEKDIQHEFMPELVRHFKMGDYAFNENNDPPELEAKSWTRNSNYVIDMSADYFTIEKRYNENCRRNVRKAVQNGLTFVEDLRLDDLIELKASSFNNRMGKSHSAYMKRLFIELLKINKVKICGVRDSASLVAAAAFAFSEQRAIYLLSASSGKGKDLRAMFQIVDRFIQKYAGRVRLLDFEGSNITNIARFFAGFGAENHPYYRISLNHPIQKVLKKLRNA